MQKRGLPELKKEMYSVNICHGLKKLNVGLLTECLPW